MKDSAHMAIYNLIFSLVLFAGILIYRYIYPKKKINLIVLLILISILPLLSILRPGSYESGDMSINAIKTMSFYSSLREGHFIPHWAGNLNALYGYPLFVFTYPLPYYLAAFFHVFGFSFIDSIKCLLITAFIASGLTMYLFLKNEFGEKAAFVGSICYLFSPYHLMDMQFRVDIGETLAFVFLPSFFTE